MRCYSLRERSESVVALRRSLARWCMRAMRLTLAAVFLGSLTCVAPVLAQTAECAAAGPTLTRQTGCRCRLRGSELFRAGIIYRGPHAWGSLADPLLLSGRLARQSRGVDQRVWLPVHGEYRCHIGELHAER